MRATTAILAVALAACAPARTRMTPSPISTCEGGRLIAWDGGAATASRAVSVSLDVLDESRDWRFDGRRRLREALAAWNATGIPVRLVSEPSADRASIRVLVMRRLPLDSADRATAFRAGVTYLRFDERGAISGAQVLIAEETPRGIPYSSSDQVATLLHELGHALGLPHIDEPTALMSPRTIVSALTPVDVALARSVYAGRACWGAPSVTATLSAASAR